MSSWWERELGLSPVITPQQPAQRAPAVVGAGMGSGLRFNNANQMQQSYADAGRSVANFTRALPGAINYAAFGPERQASSTLGLAPSRFDSPEMARLDERFVRDNILGEQERKLGWQAAQEGRPGAAAGWYGMSLLPLTPFIRGVGKAGQAATRGAVAPSARVVNEPFPVRRFDELFDRAPIQVEIPTQLRDTGMGWNETVKGPSSGFGDGANRAGAQIYRGPDGNWTYGSPHDLTIRTPLSGSGVGFRSRNPFEATGTSPLGVGADDLMSEYMGAVMAARQARLPTTDIDALFYLARGGNAEAMNLLQGVTRSSPSVPFLNAPASPNFDNIVLAHSTAKPTRLNTRGEGLLWPGGDHRSATHLYNVPTHGLGGNRNAYYPWRESLHFTQNSRVAEAPLAGSWADNRHFTLARLNDVIEANPGSLGNLNPADTFFFPRPGSPLVLPNARTVELPPRPTGFHQQRWEPPRSIPQVDGTVAEIPGRYYPQFDEAYARRIDNILGEEARSLGGDWYGVRGEDGIFPQRRMLEDYMIETGTPLVGHSRGSLPGYLEQEAGENFYRAGLGLRDTAFNDAFLNATLPGSQYTAPPSMDPTEFWRRLLSRNYLTGAEPVRFDPISSGFNF